MRVRTIAGAAALVGGTALAGYATAVRPWMLRWGATDEEVGEPLPGDDVIKRPRYQATRAVTVHAPIPDVWPWLVQIGQGRGGLYSYDRLENLFGLGFHSADRIVPELQHLGIGDEVWMVPRDASVPMYFQVLHVQPPKVLVLGPHGDPAEAYEQGLPLSSWTFVLRDRGDATTRLIARLRATSSPPQPGSWLTCTAWNRCTSSWNAR
jgi:hypothetical protein